MGSRQHINWINTTMKIWDPFPQTARLDDGAPLDQHNYKDLRPFPQTARLDVGAPLDQIYIYM